MPDAPIETPEAENAESVDQAIGIRNPMKSRPASLVLLASHRMIGAFGQVGNRMTLDPAEAPDWFTDKVNQLSEDIIEKCALHIFEVEQVPRLITKKSIFPDKGRRATAP